MTSKFSIDNRELLQRISSGKAVVGIDFGNLIVRELAAFRLAAMDSEPAPVVPDERDKTVDADDHPLLWSFNEGWNACRAAMLASSQQSPGSEPATVPGKWIPVSEQMPENKPGSYEYMVFETLNNRVNHDYWNVPSEGDDAFTPFWNYYGEHVTHWMPMPAAPQEDKP